MDIHEVGSREMILPDRAITWVYTPPRDIVPYIGTGLDDEIIKIRGTRHLRDRFASRTSPTRQVCVAHVTDATGWRRARPLRFDSVSASPRSHG
jgi:hypothetical protein